MDSDQSILPKTKLMPEEVFLLLLVVFYLWCAKKQGNRIFYFSSWVSGLWFMVRATVTEPFITLYPVEVGTLV